MDWRVEGIYQPNTPSEPSSKSQTEYVDGLVRWGFVLIKLPFGKSREHVDKVPPLKAHFRKLKSLADYEDGQPELREFDIADHDNKRAPSFNQLYCKVRTQLERA